MRPTLASTFAAFALIGCSDRHELTAPSGAPDPNLEIAVAGSGAVYTETNAPGNNQVAVFRRAANGSLMPAGRFATGGSGTGGGLGNQGAVVLSTSKRWLFAVNAGSDEISVFAVRPNGLTLTDQVRSGGDKPVSVAEYRGLVYVLNAGSDNIVGFTVGAQGTLSRLAGSLRRLSGTHTDPAQVEFSRDGELLVVTEKATNRILTFLVGGDGRLGARHIRRSVGMTPFGFAFDGHGRLIASEAFGGAPNASAVSSYRRTTNGELVPISRSVGTTETAACWIVVTGDGAFAYTTNTGSGSISGYRVSDGGRLSLLNANGRTAVTGKGSAPTDLALTADSRYLYALNSAIGTIDAFAVQGDGSLTRRSGAGGLPPNATGLAAW